MYRHLLVPLDGTELSAANTGEAIRLAAALMAQITFFHARSDTLDTADAEDLSAVILAKARAAAENAGVRCKTHTAAADRPAAAILAAASACGCDLIVMASHGSSGARKLLADSQTEAVLRQAQLPLLVTRVEANDPQAQASRAIALIQDEHRSLGAVLRGMQRLVERARKASASQPGLDHVTLLRMHQYVEAFPEKLHHPKEEQVLHRLLRERSRDSHALIEQLETDHQQELALVAAVEAALFNCPDGARGQLDTLLVLHERIDALARHVWRHMLQEERALIPLARQSLTEADWTEVAVAFEAHDDPRFGDLSDEDFRRLFASIAKLMASGTRMAG
jgi:nucleotide-binding universal stress UspA family protein/hemerythrin-like domain-containing protein